MVTLDCAVCGSSEFQPIYPVVDHFGGKSFPLGHCTDCDFMYLKQAPSPSELPSFYQNMAGSQMRGKGSALFERLRFFLLRKEASIFLKFLTPGALIADLGAGNGSLLQCAVDQGFEALAVDAYPSSQWNRPSMQYRQADLHGSLFDPEALRLNGRVPELVIMRHSLEHVFEPDQLIQKLFRLGVKYLWIVVPNCESRITRVFGSYWYLWDPPRHLNFFTPQSLKRLLSSSGYSRTHVDRYFGIDETVTSIYRYLMIRWRGRLPMAVIDFFSAKSPLAALSSAFAAVIGSRAVCAVFVEASSDATIQEKK